MGLRRGSLLYKELTIYLCQAFEDVQMKAMAIIRMVEAQDQQQGAMKRVERRGNGAQ